MHYVVEDLYSSREVQSQQFGLLQYSLNCGILQVRRISVLAESPALSS
jgi:hypothetical protein